MINARMRSGGHRRLGAIGDTQSCLTQHSQIIRAIADGHGFLGLQSMLVAQFNESGEFGFFAKNGLGNEACELIIFHDQHIGAVFVKADGLCHRAGEQSKAA